MKCSGLYIAKGLSRQLPTSELSRKGTFDRFELIFDVFDVFSYKVPI